MPSTYSIELGGRFIGLFIGVQGSGKTIASASFPKPMMVYDFDGRMTPVKRFYPNEQGIQYKVVSAYKGPGGKRRDVIDYQEFALEFALLNDRCDYATVVIDSITSLTATVIRYQLNRKTSPGKKLAGFIEVPTWDEFNGEAQEVVDLIELSKILPCHVIFTAHPVDKTEITKDSQGKEQAIRKQSITAFGNKTPSFVPNYFDEIYNFSKVGTGGATPRYVVTTTAGEDTLCKTALPVPPSFEITNTPMFKALKGFLAEHQIALAESKAKLDEIAATTGAGGGAV